MTQLADSSGMHDGEHGFRELRSHDILFQMS